MREAIGDIWSWWAAGFWIVVTTNGFVKTNGDAVMGRGIAREVKDKWEEFPTLLGKHIKQHGNVPGFFVPYRVITFPVKHYWGDKASIDLIRRSIQRLDEELTAMHKCLRIVSVRPGCGNGWLSWDVVCPEIEEVYMKHDILVVNRR